MQGDEDVGAEAVSTSAPIIVKKVIAAGGHHGGAWKVAFADFVTAMMALFMVLWLMNANQEQKEAVASYFTDPKGFEGKIGTVPREITVGSEDMEGLAEKIQEAMKGLPELAELRDQIVATVTGEGLRIELLESGEGAFFESASPAPSDSGRQALLAIGRELAPLPNEIIIEGHTDSRPYRGARQYTNWELSVERANWARRTLAEAGLGPNRVVQVRGFADIQLRKPEAPEDPSNRRISLIVKYLPGEQQGAGGDAASDEVGPPPAASERPPGSEPPNGE